MGSLSRGTPLIRRTPLRPGAPPTRRARLRPYRADRRAARHERDFGERGAAVRSLPCLLAGRGCSGPVEAAHARSRGAGGDRRSLVPLCSGHHREQHTRGVATFAAAYSIDLHSEARRIAEDLDERGLP